MRDRAHLRNFEARFHRRRLRRLASFTEALSCRGRLVGTLTGSCRNCRGRFARGGRRSSRRRGCGAGVRPGLRLVGRGWDRRRRRRRCCARHCARACNQFLRAILSVRPIGDQTLGQFLALCDGQRPDRRRRYRGEVRIIASLARRQILGVRRRFGIGVVLARAAPVAPCLDRVTGGQSQQCRQDDGQTRHPRCPAAGATPKETGFADHHDRVPNEAAGVPRGVHPGPLH